jgi:hypothetical protein
VFPVRYELNLFIYSLLFRSSFILLLSDGQAGEASEPSKKIFALLRPNKMSLTSLTIFPFAYSSALLL